MPFQPWLVAAIVAVLTVTVARWLYGPPLHQIRERYGRLQQLKAQMTHAQALARDPGVPDGLLEHHLGQTATVAHILESLTKDAEQHRLELTVVQPSTDEAAPLVSVGSALTVRGLPLTVQLTGQYRQISEFLSGLSTAPFLSAVRELTVSRAGDTRVGLTAHLVLMVYLPQEGSKP